MTVSQTSTTQRVHRGPRSYISGHSLTTDEARDVERFLQSRLLDALSPIEQEERDVERLIMEEYSKAASFEDDGWRKQRSWNVSFNVDTTIVEEPESDLSGTDFELFPPEIPKFGSTVSLAKVREIYAAVSYFIDIGCSFI